MVFEESFRIRLELDEKDLEILDTVRDKIKEDIFILFKDDLDKALNTFFDNVHKPECEALEL